MALITRTFTVFCSLCETRRYFTDQVEAERYKLRHERSCRSGADPMHIEDHYNGERA